MSAADIGRKHEPARSIWLGSPTVGVGAAGASRPPRLVDAEVHFRPAGRSASQYVDVETLTAEPDAPVGLVDRGTDAVAFRAARPGAVELEARNRQQGPDASAQHAHASNVDIDRSAIDCTTTVGVLCQRPGPTSQPAATIRRWNAAHGPGLE